MNMHERPDEEIKKPRVIDSAMSAANTPVHRREYPFEEPGELGLEEINIGDLEIGKIVYILHKDHKYYPYEVIEGGITTLLQTPSQTDAKRIFLVGEFFPMGMFNEDNKFYKEIT